MRKRLIHIIPWIVFLIALVLLASHLLAWEQIKIDSTTLILLAILLLSPFIEQIRRIRVGEFEAEIAPTEVKRVKSEDLLDLLDKDYVLALAKLRMELERTLNRLYVLSTPNDKQRTQLGLNRLVSELVRSEVLPTQLSGPIREVFYLCNRAVHGEQVRPDDARSIVGIGIQVLEHINSIVKEFMVKPIETNTISSTEAQAYMDAKYRVTTVVPLVENPVLNVRILDQEGIDALIEGYEEYAEFLVGIEKTDIRDDINQQNQ